MIEDENEINKKQEYLRKEIIDQGYDPNDFAKYLKAFKGNEEVDINLYNFEELEEIINNYKVNRKPNEIKNDNFNNDEEDVNNQINEKNIINEEENILNSPNEEKINNFDNQNFDLNNNNINNNENNNNENKNIIKENNNNNASNDFDESKNINNENNNNNNENNNNNNLINKNEEKIFNIEKYEDNFSFSEEENEEKSKESTNNENNNISNRILDFESEEINEDYPTASASNNSNKNQIYIPCQKQKPNNLISQDFSLKISNAICSKDNLFSYSYLKFTLKCQCQNKNISIERKLDDFEWLHNKLSLFFPTIFIPPCPKNKKFFKINNNQEFLNKNINYVQQFIDSLIKNKLIKQSEIFCDFVMLEKKDFDKKKCFYDKIQRIKNLSLFTNIQGKINVTINPYLDFKATSIENDIKEKANLYKKLNIAIKNLTLEMDNISQKFFEISKIFLNLQNTYYNSKAIENDKISFYFKNFNKLFENWSKLYKSQKNFFNNEIKYFFKYIQKEVNEFQYIVNEYTSAKISYNNFITEKKEKDYKSWDFMEKIYGYLLNKTVREYERLHLNHFIRLNEHFQNINNKKNVFAGDYLSFMKLLSFNLS